MQASFLVSILRGWNRSTSLPIILPEAKILLREFVSPTRYVIIIVTLAGGLTNFVTPLPPFGTRDQTNGGYIFHRIIGNRKQVPIIFPICYAAKYIPSIMFGVIIDISWRLGIRL